MEQIVDIPEKLAVIHHLPLQSRRGDPDRAFGGGLKGESLQGDLGSSSLDTKVVALAVDPTFIVRVRLFARQRNPFVQDETRSCRLGNRERTQFQG